MLFTASKILKNAFYCIKNIELDPVIAYIMEKLCINIEIANFDCNSLKMTILAMK